MTRIWVLISALTVAAVLSTTVGDCRAATRAQREAREQQRLQSDKQRAFTHALSVTGSGALTLGDIYDSYRDIAPGINIVAWMVQREKLAWHLSYSYLDPSESESYLDLKIHQMMFSIAFYSASPQFRSRPTPFFYMSGGVGAVCHRYGAAGGLFAAPDVSSIWDIALSMRGGGVIPLSTLIGIDISAGTFMTLWGLDNGVSPDIEPLIDLRVGLIIYR